MLISLACPTRRNLCLGAPCVTSPCAPSPMRPLVLALFLQASNVWTLPVQPPAIDIIDVYDTLQMSDEDRAVDPCLVQVVNVTTQTVIVVEGFNFGMSTASFSISLTNTLDATDVQTCDVCFLSHKLARCISNTSRALAYDLSVTVVNQTSAPKLYDYSVIVQAPSFATIGPLVAPAEGGSLLVITGSNFKDRGFVTLTRDGVVLRCETPPLGEEGSVNGVYYARDGKTIQCRVPPGTGAGYSVAVTARGVYGVAGGFVFSYAAPSNITVTPSMLVTTGGSIVIAGRDFGIGMNTSESTLSLAQWLVVQRRSVTLGGVPCAVVSWSSTEIVCQAAEGVAAAPHLVVHVDGQVNAVQVGLVAYYPPTLTGFLFPATGDTSGGYLVAFAGANLGPATSALTLLFGDYRCPVAVHTHVSGVCVVGPGAGRGLAVVVARVGVDGSIGVNSTAPQMRFSYDAPAVVSVRPVDPMVGYPTVGNFWVTIEGTSFTTLMDSALFSVLVSNRPCDSPVNRTHTSFTCRMPANYGKHHPIVVTAVGQASAPFLFDYDGPVVRSVVPVRDVFAFTGYGATFDAKHGTDVIISGLNFGNDDTTHGVIHLNGSECTNALFVRDGEIRCTLPGDQVVGRTPLTVTTWNPAQFSASDTNGTQTSAPFLVYVSCPEDFFGRENEVREGKGGGVGMGCGPCESGCGCAGGVGGGDGLPAQGRL
jgi:hypothetical protein